MSTLSEFVEQDKEEEEDQVLAAVERETRCVFHEQPLISPTDGGCIALATRVVAKLASTNELSRLLSASSSSTARPFCCQSAAGAERAAAEVNKRGSTLIVFYNSPVSQLFTSALLGLTQRCAPAVNHCKQPAC